MKYLYLILILFCFSSCYTTNKMNKQVTKGYVTYPIEFTETVIKLLPVKEKDSISTIVEIIKGDTITDTSYVYVDCDTVVITKENDRVVKIPSVTKVIKDTIKTKEIQIKTIEDTRKITVLNKEKEELLISNTSKSSKIKYLTILSSLLLSIIILYLLFKSLIKKI